MTGKNEIAAVRLAAWPELDRTSWERAILNDDPFEPCAAVVGSWRRKTIQFYEMSYAFWLGWLNAAGDLDNTSRPQDRVSPDKVRIYLFDMREQGLAPFTISGRISGLGQVLRVMCPDHNWDWIARAASRLHAVARPVKKIEARLRPPEDVLDLAFDLMGKAELGEVNPRRDTAVQFRDGLLIAFLLYRPFRTSTLSAMRIGHELYRAADCWRIAVEGEQTKSGRPIEATWPKGLVEPLERYLDHYRPALLAGDAALKEDHLWVVRPGAPMIPQMIHVRVTRLTKERFGTAINPHAFRHLAATVIATSKPDSVTDVARVLSHTTLETSEKHYNKAQMITAADQYHQTLAAKRQPVRTHKVKHHNEPPLLQLIQGKPRP